MKCKNCGKEIETTSTLWFHKDNVNVYCEINKAEPVEEKK